MKKVEGVMHCKKDLKDEAKAGRAYNKSEKHKKAESAGMKKAMKKKKR